MKRRQRKDLLRFFSRSFSLSSESPSSSVSSEGRWGGSVKQHKLPAKNSVHEQGWKSMNGFSNKRVPLRRWIRTSCFSKTAKNPSKRNMGNTVIRQNGLHTFQCNTIKKLRPQIPIFSQWFPNV